MDSAVQDHRGENNISVVGFVVVADPGSHESPEILDSGVSTNFGNLLWLSTCKRGERGMRMFFKYNYLPRTGLFQRFLGASRAVNGV